MKKILLMLCFYITSFVSFALDADTIHVKKVYIGKKVVLVNQKCIIKINDSLYLVNGRILKIKKIRPTNRKNFKSN